MGEPISEPITEIKFKKISCSSKYEIDLNSTTKNKTKHKILKLYLEKTKDQPYDDSIKDLAKNITVYNQLIDNFEKLKDDYNKVVSKINRNKSSGKISKLNNLNSEEAKLAKEIAETKF